MKTVNINQSQTDEYSGQKIIGTELILFYQGNHGGTQCLNTDFQLRNTSVSGILKRQGQQPFEVFSTTFDVLMKIANYHKDPIDALWACTGDYTTNQNTYIFDFMTLSGVVQPPSGANKQQGQLNCYLYFPCAIDLRGEDKFEVSVNFGSGTVVNGGNVDPAACFIQFAQIAGMEHHMEDGLPQIKVFSIQQNQATMQVPCGSGVDDVFIISTDRVDQFTANQVIQKVTVAADGLRYTKLTSELLAMRSNQVEAFWSDFHIQDFLLLEARNAQNVNVDLTLNVPNVTAGNNYVVVTRCVGGGGEHAELAHQANMMLAKGMLTKDAHAKIHAHIGQQRKLKGRG